MEGKKAAKAPEGKTDPLKFSFQKLDKEGALIKMDFSPLIRSSFKDFLLNGPGGSTPLVSPPFDESGINTPWRLVFAASAAFISKITGVSRSGAAGWPGGGREEGGEREGERPAGWRDGEQVLVKATRLCICHRRDDGMRTSTSGELEGSQAGDVGKTGPPPAAIPYSHLP